MRRHQRDRDIARVAVGEHHGVADDQHFGQVGGGGEEEGVLCLCCVCRAAVRARAALVEAEVVVMDLLIEEGRLVARRAGGVHAHPRRAVGVHVRREVRAVRVAGHVRERFCRRAAKALVHELPLGGGHSCVRRGARRAADVVVGVEGVEVCRHVRRNVRRDARHRTRCRRQVDAVGRCARVDVVELRAPFVVRRVAQCARGARGRVDVVELRAPSVERRVVRCLARGRAPVRRDGLPRAARARAVVAEWCRCRARVQRPWRVRIRRDRDRLRRPAVVVRCAHDRLLKPAIVAERWCGRARALRPRVAHWSRPAHWYW